MEEVLGEEPKVSPPRLDLSQQDRQEATSAGGGMVTAPLLAVALLGDVGGGEEITPTLRDGSVANCPNIRQCGFLQGQTPGDAERRHTRRQDSCR